MPKKPIKQGELDGLCGVYTIVNAFNNVLPKNITNNLFREDIFKVAIKEVDYEIGLKNAIFNGIKFEVLKNILGTCIEHIDKKYNITVGIEDISDTYSEKIHILSQKVDEFLDGRGKVVIVGLSGKFDHWSIVTRVSDSGKTWHMIDSDTIKEIRVARLTTRENPTKNRDILINHCELVGLFLSEEDGYENDDD